MQVVIRLIQVEFHVIQVVVDLIKVVIRLIHVGIGSLEHTHVVGSKSESITALALICRNAMLIVPAELGSGIRVWSSVRLARVMHRRVSQHPPLRHLTRNDGLLQQVVIHLIQVIFHLAQAVFNLITVIIHLIKVVYTIYFKW